MGLLAEFEVRCEALPLVDVATTVPDATVVLEIQFNHGRRPPFLVHVTEVARGRVDDALEASAFAETAAFVGTDGDTHHYKVSPAFGLEEQLGDHLDDLDGLRDLATADAIIHRIRVTPDGWRQTGWFAHRDAFERFREFWVRNDAFVLHRLAHDDDPAPAGDGLTDRQREALRIAYERGYFDVPRGTTLEAVAAELDVSASALSERLRRAQTRLVETTVAATWPPLPDRTTDETATRT